LIAGEGDGAVEGDTVVVHYVGKTADDAVFDSSWERGEPYPVTLGPTAGVIEGWNEGLLGVKIGERRRLVIGSDKAYGAEGRDPIPPNAPLAFEIDVVDIIKAPPAG
jgi:peptidylprolyl isomerase